MPELRSVCVYCGSSDTVDAAYFDLARALGKAMAERGTRLVYGGGRVGLMGAVASAAHEHGGEVLGVIPNFLLKREVVFEAVEHRVVDTMHERKQIMFDEADAFIVLPGGIGTLEEAVETLSWMRLGLHQKPMAFLAEDDYWSPLFSLIEHIIEGRFSPAALRDLMIDAHDPGTVLEHLDAATDEMEEKARHIAHAR